MIRSPLRPANAGRLDSLVAFGRAHAATPGTRRRSVSSGERPGDRPDGGAAGVFDDVIGQHEAIEVLTAAVAASRGDAGRSGARP